MIWPLSRDRRKMKKPPTHHFGKWCPYSYVVLGRGSNMLHMEMKKVLNTIPINLTTSELQKTTAWRWLHNEICTAQTCSFWIVDQQRIQFLGPCLANPTHLCSLCNHSTFLTCCLRVFFLAPTSDACWDGTLNMAEVAPMVQKWVQAFLLKSSIGQHMAMGSPAIQCKTQLLSPLCPEVPFEAVLRSSSIGWCQWIGFAVERTKTVEPSMWVDGPYFLPPIIRIIILG